MDSIEKPKGFREPFSGWLKKKMQSLLSKRPKVHTQQCGKSDLWMGAKENLQTEVQTEQPRRILLTYMVKKSFGL